jgi:hypothetical protein
MFKNPEGYYPANDHPLWNQSVYFNMYDPQNKIGCFIRIGILENLKETNNWFVFFKDGKPLYTRLNMNLPYTSNRIDKGIEVSGVRVKSIEPLKNAFVEFSDADFSVSLNWQTIHPMQDSISLTSNVHSDVSLSEISQLHMEAPCRVSGMITVSSGQRIEINGIGFRDISVGPRKWDALRHYRLAWPIFSNYMAFAGLHGFLTSGQDVYMNMFHDGTEWLPVTRIDDRNEYDEDEMTLKSMHWKFWDSRDRMWEFNAKPLFRWFFPLNTFVVAEHMMEFRLHDNTVGYGLGECGYRFPWEGNGN